MFRLESVPSSATLQQALKKFDRVLVFGLGGSILPLRALVAAEELEEKIICWDDLDLRGLDKILSDPKTLVALVSKSGETLEIQAWLSELWGKVPKERWLMVTDKTKGRLRSFTDKEKLLSIEIPSDIGGRFTHFSPFHRLLLEWAGVDYEKGLQAAVSERDRLKADASELENLFQKFYAAERVRELVLWGYGRAGYAFAAWAQQALAESLGKKSKSLRHGKTCVLLRGSQDQHSVLQHLMDGPQFHGLWFFVEERSLEEREAHPGLNALSVLAEATRRSFEERLSNPETAQVIETWKFPLGLQEMAKAVIRLQAFVEYAGERMGIDAFDQPGVERGKEIARELMANSALS